MDHFLHDWGYLLLVLVIVIPGWAFIHICFSGKLWDHEYDENGYSKKPWEGYTKK
jgi:hypothetical protein